MPQKSSYQLENSKVNITWDADQVEMFFFCVLVRGPSLFVCESRKI